MESLGAARTGAILLGLVAVAGFGVYHWFFVAPVAAVFVEGIVWAVAGGAAVGWAYQREFLDKGRTGPWWGLSFGALLAVTLVPAEVVGVLWGPFPDVTSARTFFTALWFAFTPVPVAILASWLLRGRTSVGWPFVAAALVLNFMVAGSVAQFGGRGVTFLLFAGFFVFETLAGVALWWLHGRLHGSPSPRSIGRPIGDGTL